MNAAGDLKATCIFEANIVNIHSFWYKTGNFLPPYMKVFPTRPIHFSPLLFGALALCHRHFVFLGQSLNSICASA